MNSLFDLPFDEPPPAQLPAHVPERVPEPEPPARRIFTVTQLTAAIRTLLEEQFVEVWVEGELSNCRVWNTGHMYFTLKDAGAQIKGVMFKSALRHVRFKPQDGLRVVARGRRNVGGLVGAAVHRHVLVPGRLTPPRSPRRWSRARGPRVVLLRLSGRAGDDGVGP